MYTKIDIHTCFIFIWHSLWFRCLTRSKHKARLDLCIHCRLAYHPSIEKLSQHHQMNCLEPELLHLRNTHRLSPWDYLVNEPSALWCFPGTFMVSNAHCWVVSFHQPPQRICPKIQIVLSSREKMCRSRASNHTDWELSPHLQDMKRQAKGTVLRGPSTLLPENILEHASSLTLALLWGKRRTEQGFIVVCLALWIRKKQ